MDTTVNTFVMSQGDFTGDELFKELEMSGLVTSGLLSTLTGIFKQIAKTQDTELVI